MAPAAVVAIAQILSLTRLPDHWAVIVASALACQLILLASRVLSPRVAPASYRRLAPLKRLDWDVHVVSSVHAVAVVALAAPLLADPVLRYDPVFGYSPRAGMAYAIATGYFFWDAILSLVHIRAFGVGFLIHGVACFAVFLFSFRPFLMWFGSFFLLYEVSTPFLNAHWFMDKCGWTGSRLQLLNGIAFLATFFGARIVGGFYMSYMFFIAITAPNVRAQLPAALLVLYAGANVVLNLLNVYWFRAMIQSLQRRFQRPATKLAEVPAKHTYTTCMAAVADAHAYEDAPLIEEHVQHQATLYKPAFNPVANGGQYYTALAAEEPDSVAPLRR